MSVQFLKLLSVRNISKTSRLSFQTSTCVGAAKSTTSAAGGVMGLGKGKKKAAGKLGAMEKQEIPVETDPERLVHYVCGSNIYVTGEDIKLKDDSEYPEWLWGLRVGPAPALSDLDPDTKQYWQRVRKLAMQRNNRLKSLQRF